MMNCRKRSSSQSSVRTFFFLRPYKQERELAGTDIYYMLHTLYIISFNPQKELSIANLPIHKWRNWFSGKLCGNSRSCCLTQRSWHSGLGLLDSKALNRSFYHISHLQWGTQVTQTWCSDLAWAIYSLLYINPNVFIKPRLCSRPCATCYGNSENTSPPSRALKDLII